MELKNNNMRTALAKAEVTQQSNRNVNYDPVDEAEKVISSLKRADDKYGEKYIVLTTSQIRKFLTAVNVLRNKVDVYCAQNLGAKILPNELKVEVKFLKVNALYLAGKDTSKGFPVRDFVKKAGLENKILAIGNDIAAFEKFCKYIEALVAFHKYQGGRDR
ncbi:MAG: type III-A CRISPR-associated protein Csm2 [Phascolarctobacterium sp.]|uniref:type III-A CRISPR-associated protein Csm2 n=1 Tax=Phascolarctobacterium sp. TaxID=2049039 RepID=UPI0026DB24C6|nr:type III-A CRISPR-associated protein Csm2 [Phascolarctobacterium sp.]MDO4921637.1 type III-A CRISPR-associated protein Csm2 [Phascolarctobacterium sp.]